MFLRRRLYGRAVGRRLRIIEVALHRRGRGTLHRHAAGHGRTPFRGAGGVVLRIARGRGLRRIRYRRYRLLRRDGRHARTARIGIEPRIAVVDEVVAIAARGIARKQDLAAAAVLLVRGKLRRRGRRLRRPARIGSGLRGNVDDGRGADGLRRLRVCRGRRLRGAGGRFGKRCAALGRGNIVVRNGLRFLARGAVLRARSRAEHELFQRRSHGDPEERSRNQQGIQHIRACGGEHRADGIGDKSEDHAAARALGDALGSRRPASAEVAPVTVPVKAFRRGGMHDEKDRRQKQHDFKHPFRGEVLSAGDEHDGIIDRKQEQRINEEPEQPHKKRGDGYADIAEHIRTRDGDEKDDRAEQQQGHPYRFAAQKHVFSLVFLIIPSADSVQNCLRPAPLRGALSNSKFRQYIV